MKLLVRASTFAAVVILAIRVFAQNIPLQNWTPAPWPAPNNGRIAGNAASTAFMPIMPCRAYDSRSASALTGLTSRTIVIAAAPCVGIPEGVSAYSINITVFGSTASGSYEFVTAYATGTTRPSVSTMNFLTGTQTSSAATVAAGTSGNIDVYTTYTTHFVIDINGVYSGPQKSPSEGFLSSTTTAIAVRGESITSTGVRGSSWYEHGVVGTTTAPSGWAGVFGNAERASGVFGKSTRSTGVRAESTQTDGLAAYGGRDGAYAEGTRTGVLGVSTGTSGALYGVIGTAMSTDDGSAGVLGRIDEPMTWSNSSVRSGVRGDGKLAGVIGFSENIGVAGIRANADGTGRVEGYLGWGPYGVFSIGDTAASGTKSFVEPHATDPGKVIKYVSLEGPEAGTYFRGRGVLSQGRAVIDVPEDFRMVTDPEGLTVHVTPLGRLAIVAAVSVDLNEIVVESNRDVEFSYIVYGVRKAFKDFQPIQREEGEFMPTSATSIMPSGLPPETQRRLIETGVYNEDGTVNLDTAERLGWTKLWHEHSRPYR